MLTDDDMRALRTGADMQGLAAEFAELEALAAPAAVPDDAAAEIANLKTVMIAAAEEIAAHWDAHCDAEGYGPANLMHRLEQGIPSEYGYTAGAFAKLKAENDALRAAPAAPSVPQWQPRETMPMDGGTYLVADAVRGNVAPHIRGVIYNNIGTANDWQYGEAITHWMPLPAAPTDGGQGHG